MWRIPLTSWKGVIGIGQVTLPALIAGAWMEDPMTILGSRHRPSLPDVHTPNGQRAPEGVVPAENSVSPVRV